LKVEDASLLDTIDPKEDEISDPEEDTFAGQLAAARGQKVWRAVREEDEDDESGTDEEEESSSDSSSDSD
jgi:translocation protein SEC63